MPFLSALVAHWLGPLTQRMRRARPSWLGAQDSGKPVSDTGHEGAQRRPTPLVYIYMGLSTPLAPEVFIDVWCHLAFSFGIPPELIRPEDTIESLSALSERSFADSLHSLDRWLPQTQVSAPACNEPLLLFAKRVEAARVW
jgi:hypothetical protein